MWERKTTLKQSESEFNVVTKQKKTLLEVHKSLI